RAVTHRGQRVRALGVAMPGSGLRDRMRRMASGLPAPPLSRVRLASTVVLCALSTVVFAGATLASRPPSFIDHGPAHTWQTARRKPKFDVVSIRPCGPNSALGTGGRGGVATELSPGRLVGNCLRLMDMITNAYIRFADGRGHDAWLSRDTTV